MAQSAPAAVLMLLLLSIIATPANKTRLYSDDRFRLRLLLSVRPAAGCMLCVGEPMRLSEQLAGSDSFSLSRLFLKSLIKNDYHNISFFFYNRATINAQRIRTDYLRLLACVICPLGRGLFVRRVICAWYIGRDE